MHPGRRPRVPTKVPKLLGGIPSIHFNVFSSHPNGASTSRRTGSTSSHVAAGPAHSLTTQSTTSESSSTSPSAFGTSNQNATTYAPAVLHSNEMPQRGESAVEREYNLALLRTISLGLWPQQTPPPHSVTGSSSDELPYDLPAQAPCCTGGCPHCMPDPHRRVLFNFPWVDGESRVPATQDMAQVIDEYNPSFLYLGNSASSQLSTPNANVPHAYAFTNEANHHLIHDLYRNNPQPGVNLSSTLNASPAFTIDGHHQAIHQHNDVLQAQNNPTQPPLTTSHPADNGQSRPAPGPSSFIPYQLAGNAGAPSPVTCSVGGYHQLHNGSHPGLMRTEPAPPCLISSNSYSQNDGQWAPNETNSQYRW